MLWLPLKVYYQWWFMQNPVSSTASSVSIKTRCGRSARLPWATHRHHSREQVPPVDLEHGLPLFIILAASLLWCSQPLRGEIVAIWSAGLGLKLKPARKMYFISTPLLIQDFLVQGLNWPKEPLRCYSLISMNNIWWLSGACGHLDLMVKYEYFLKRSTVFQAHLSQWLPRSRGHRVFHGASPVASLSNY